MRRRRTWPNTTCSALSNPSLPPRPCGQQLTASSHAQIPLNDHNFAALASLLKIYGKSKNLDGGRHVHAHISSCRYNANSFLGNSLLQMYGNCGNVQDAQAVFDKMPNPDLYSWNILIKAYGQNGSLDNARAIFARMHHRDVVSWTAMITANVQNGENKEALDTFHQMRHEGLKPDKITFTLVLDACASLEALEEGQAIHAAIIGRGYEREVVLGTALVNMYGKCGNTRDANSVFAGMLSRDAVSWTAMIVVFARNGHSADALDLFDRMKSEGITPDHVMFICALNACSSLTALRQGQEIHSATVCSACEQDVFVGTAVISMYGKCGRLHDAWNIFSRLPWQNVVSWNAMIEAYADSGHGKEALDLFSQMLLEGFKPNEVSFISALNACAMVVSLEVGKEIHSAIVQSGYELDSDVGTALINIYGKCGTLHDARSLFRKMSDRNVVCWTAMISALSKHGHCKEALDVFHQMQAEGLKPTDITFVCVLNACINLTFSEAGKRIHAVIVDLGYEQDIVVGTALVNMYGKLKDPLKARCIFDKMPYQTLVSWNSMIAVLAQNGHGMEALDLFHQMRSKGFTPNTITYVCALDASATLALLMEGREIHAAIVDIGYEQDVFVGTALVYMYGKCGSLHDARRSFNKMSRTTVCWNAMIVVFSQNGHDKEALESFYEMQNEGFKPNDITFICALDACASLGAIELGEEVHDAVIDAGYEQDVTVGTALVNVYGKCGCLSKARNIFDNMSHRNVISWNALIAAFAQNGHGKEALDLYCHMQSEGLKPNNVTFVCILTACSYAGLIDDGRNFFVSMKTDHGLSYATEHYVCMIDLLGRAGHLDEAEGLINTMPIENAPVAWLCLLGACKIHGDAERGVYVANHCFELDPEEAAPYVMLSNIYAIAGRHDELAHGDFY